VKASVDTEGDSTEYYCQTLTRGGSRHYFLLDGKELETAVLAHDRHATQDETSRVQRDRLGRFKFHHRSAAPPPPPATSPGERTAKIEEAKI